MASRRFVRLISISAGALAVGSTLSLTAPGTALAASVGQNVVTLAAGEAGVPYVWAGASPSQGFDCSGLVQYVYAHVGIQLPHNAQMQYDATQHIAKADMQLGDLLFLPDSSGHIYHVGIYAGGDQWWVASHPGTVVHLQTIYTSNYLVGRPYGVSAVHQSAVLTTVSRVASTPAQAPAPDPSPVSVSPAPAVAAPGAWTALLQEGSQGPLVLQVQKALGLGGTGYFGPVTRSLVVAFQQSHNLQVDGIVGPQTAGALFGSSTATAGQPEATTVLVRAVSDSNGDNSNGNAEGEW